MRASTCLALIMVFSALGCSEATEPPPVYVPPQQPPIRPPVPPAPAPHTPVFSAEIYGVKWDADEILVKRLENNTIEISGEGVETWPEVRMTLRLVNVFGEGEYSLNADGEGSLFAMASGWYRATTHEFDWPTQHARITILTANRVAGTFEGFVPSYNGSGEVFFVFNGRFDVTY